MLMTINTLNLLITINTLNRSVEIDQRYVKYISMRHIVTQTE